MTPPSLHATARLGQPHRAPATDPGTPAGPGVEVLLHAVADPTRWTILGHLARTELCTTHLQDLLQAKQPVMSHHLKVLRDAGLVDTEPCGRFTYYRLRPGALDEVAAVLGGLAAAAHAGPRDRRSC